MKSTYLRPGTVIYFMYLSVCLSSNLCMFVGVFSFQSFVLHCNSVSLHSYSVENMLKDKEAEVIDRVSKTMDDLYYENQRYKPYAFHNLIILN